MIQWYNTSCQYILVNYQTLVCCNQCDYNHPIQFLWSLLHHLLPHDFHVIPTKDGPIFGSEIAKASTIIETPPPPATPVGVGILGFPGRSGTLPETNIAPENRPLERRFLLETTIFRGYVSFGECILQLSPPFVDDAIVRLFRNVLAGWIHRGHMLTCFSGRG